MRTFSLRTVLLSVTVAALVLGGVTGPLAAGASTTAGMQVAADPGPSGDFLWKGLNWQRRTSAERWGPAYNGRYEAANVVGPDSRGYITLRVTNPDGRSPVSAEFSTTRGGFGYGTYTAVVAKRLDVMQPELVWGCLFTYDAANAPGYTEIDVCESSAWGGGKAQNEPVVQAHGYWFDATKSPGQGSVASIFPAGSASVQTHRMVWAPQKLTYETYAGHGFGGALLKRTELTGSRVPVPTREKLHFNFWVFGGNGGNPDQVEPDTVEIRDLSFTPAGATAPVTSEPAPTPPPSEEPAPTEPPPAQPRPTEPTPAQPTPTDPTPPFDDVRSTTHRAAIRAAAASGVTLGCNPPLANHYCPTDPVTREQMATFLDRSLGLDAGGAGTFDDVSPRARHHDAIERVAAAGITEGCDATSFCPRDAVTREQMASFLARALGLEGAGDGGFDDVRTGGTHAAAIAAIAEQGITTGCDAAGTSFCPTEPITRAQMATFLYRAGLT